MLEEKKTYSFILISYNRSNPTLSNVSIQTLNFYYCAKHLNIETMVERERESYNTSNPTLLNVSLQTLNFYYCAKHLNIETMVV